MNQDPAKSPREDSRKRKRRGVPSMSESSVPISSPNAAVSSATPSVPYVYLPNQQSFSTNVVNRLFAPPLYSYPAGIQQLESSMASSAAAARVATAFFEPHAPSDAAGPWGLYGGNIAAACVAANEEVVKRRSEGVTEDEDQERKRLRDSSRLIAWQSRERKRIEMEVLRERQTQLQQENQELRKENEQLQSIIQWLKSVIQASSAEHPRTAAAGRDQPTSGMSPGMIFLGSPQSTTTGTSDLISRPYPALSNTSKPPSVPLPIGIMGRAQPQSVQFHEQPQHLNLPHLLQGTNPPVNLFPYLGQVIPLGLPSLHNANSYPFHQEQLYQRHLQEHFMQQNNSDFFSAAQGILAHSLLGTNDIVSPLNRPHFNDSRDHRLLGNDYSQEQKQESILEGSPTRADSILMQSGGFPLDISALLRPTEDFQVNVPLVRVPEAKQDTAADPYGTTTAAPKGSSSSGSGKDEEGISCPSLVGDNPQEKQERHSQNRRTTPPDAEQQHHETGHR